MLTNGDGAQARTRDVTIADAIDIGLRLHEDGRHEEAAGVYAKVLAAAPDHVDALQFLGILHHQAGRSEEGLALIRRALERMPDGPDLHANLGKILGDLGRAGEAAQAYRAALALDPAHMEALCNLGQALEADDRPREAEALYRRGKAADPSHGTVHNHLLSLLYRTGRAPEAARLDTERLKDAPRTRETLDLLVLNAVTAGDTDGALRAVEEQIAQDPDNLHARLVRAALSGEDVPERASDAYVTDAFDTMAEVFDDKLAFLKYRAPQFVAEAVARALCRPGQNLDILDAGCGTGLCGPHLRPFARTLTGVDLSDKMLAKAHARAEYDDLALAEITRYLVERPSSFDVVVSADTLCYFGRLTDVVGGAFSALRPGGLLVFTLEDGGDGQADGYRLDPHGRYAHRRDYVETVLRDAGFERPQVETATLREQMGLPVPGLVVTTRRP